MSHRYQPGDLFIRDYLIALCDARARVFNFPHGTLFRVVRDDGVFVCCDLVVHPADFVRFHPSDQDHDFKFRERHRMIPLGSARSPAKVIAMEIK